MKRKISILLACFTALGLLLASCGGGKSALAGRWLMAEGGSFDDIELLKDGTGIIDNDEIKWKVEKNRIYFSNADRATSFDYQLAGSKLTLTNEDGDIYVYLKPGGSSALIGTWVSAGEDALFESLEFSKNGRGTADGENFKWAVDGNKLFIIDFGELEYKVSGSSLTLTFYEGDEGDEGESIQLKKQ